jgi:hemerythrin-like domain-containing protein
MAVQIGAKPASGFDDPIGMMQDCHRRIERFLDILHRVVRKARRRALTAEEVQAVETALHYFRTSGLQHSEDEEKSLFSRLRALGATDVLQQVERLESDHRAAAVLHEEADRIYTRWISAGLLSTKDAAALEAATGELARIYSTHIAVEEGIVFPRAAALFGKDLLHTMSAEFRRRRALD